MKFTNNKPISFIHPSKFKYTPSISDSDYKGMSYSTIFQSIIVFIFLPFQVKWTNTRIFDQFILDIRRQNPYQHLKVVRYGGYLGGTADKEFLKKSLALEKAIVRPCDHSSYSRKKSSKVERRSRSRAWRQLQGKVPKGVELVIL